MSDKDNLAKHRDELEHQAYELALEIERMQKCIQHLTERRTMLNTTVLAIIQVQAVHGWI